MNQAECMSRTFNPKTAVLTQRRQVFCKRNQIVTNEENREKHHLIGEKRTKDNLLFSFLCVLCVFAFPIGFTGLLLLDVRHFDIHIQMMSHSFQSGFPVLTGQTWRYGN